MAKRNRLIEIEQERGALEEVIPPLVNEAGQQGAAQALGTSQATISKWLRDHGYVLKQVYVKEGGDRQPVT